ncbi:MAG: hypothetical protein IT317_06265 [Anaerolineales bacterium]|nr:hypothetical protein [Anaerolineales bacterium]
MSLSSAQIDTISRQIYRQFPEVTNAAPVVQDQPGAKALGGGSDRYLLTFRGRGLGPGGQAINRIVRVVADDRGKVIKVSTSR